MVAVTLALSRCSGSPSLCQVYAFLGRLLLRPSCRRGYWIRLYTVECAAGWKEERFAMDGTLTPIQAATQAAAQYVYQSAHKKGIEAGWNAGWEDIRAGLSMDAKAADTCSVSAVDDHAGFCGEEESKLQLDPAWAALFSEGAARRKREARKEREVCDSVVSSAEERQGQPRGGALVDLGGIEDQERRKRAVELYGERAEEVLTADAAMEARFTEASVSASAPLWPAVSLRYFV